MGDGCDPRRVGTYASTSARRSDALFSWNRDRYGSDEMTTPTLHGSTHWYLPSTPLGRWSVALFGLFVIAFVLFLAAAIASAGEWEEESFFDPLIPAILLLVGATSAVAAAAVGIAGIVRQHERSVAVIVVTALSASASFFFVGELLSVVGVLPQH